MTTEAITPLRERMIEDMSARKLGTHSQRSHIYSCKQFAAFLKRSPETATCEDIRRFQLHLAGSGTTICNRNRIMTGLRFLFRVTLRRLDLAAEIYHLREPKKISQVVSTDEARRLLAVTIGGQFHEDLMRMSGNPFFSQTLGRLNRIRRLLEYRSMVDRDRLYLQCKEHLEILDLLEAGKNVEASHFVRRHLNNAMVVKSSIHRSKRVLIEI
jgi:FCD domain-containing protein/integrase-like protein